MATKYVSVVFDRLSHVPRTGRGKVEIRVYISRSIRKYVVVDETTKAGWRNYKPSRQTLETMARYEEIINAMKLLGEDMTMENFNAHAEGISANISGGNELKKSFIDFIKNELQYENLREGTIRHKNCVITALECFGKIKTIGDLTVPNIRSFDRWLRSTGERTDVTIWGYHKRVKKYTRILKQNGTIDIDPYQVCKFSHGQCKERTPLSENELLKMRKMRLEKKLERVRDLFIFSAYTGLAFSDVQSFDFDNMTQKIDNMYYIDGSRTKTGVKFYTPILKPAMDVLKKYNFILPSISNQKANDFLHVIEAQMGLKKNLTFHLARHTFATLALANDVPIENVARMLGHTDIKTTQIYAKILNTTIERHSCNLQRRIK